ncbi:helix-turn-helix transcriptional regulator [Kitasatospora sp. DSM 101779]|uniref:helix-turn-helix transcriptional regulator n=1 Tax=Kitasatospora sp. DSM 101779 TaxID=2853165 RepID=UPI0021DB2ED5|nr:winged helix-turn-helix domain-containing protein [Kitasatospora sp. DSM 101779]MCU7826004.1 winged helix-turn-helix domain-containing protein [Kitasatospora sp. DSM 101779]
MADEHEPRTSWTFLTHHARVLLLISRDPQVRVRDLAAACGVTERAVQAIITDLDSAGYLTRTRHGRRNHYRVTRDMHFRHPVEAGHEIAGFLELFAGLSPPTGAEDGRDTRSGARQHHERPSTSPPNGSPVAQGGHR